MAECDECFICFTASPSVALGEIVSLRTGGCGCSHLVHEWCLVKWHTVYANGKKECPLCRMPGEIQGINEMINKYQDRVAVTMLMTSDYADLQQRIEAREARRRRRTRLYMLMMVLLVFIMCLLTMYSASLDQVSAAKSAAEKDTRRDNDWQQYMGP